MSALHNVLPQVQAPVQSPQTQSPFPSDWASDFLSQRIQAPVPAIKHIETQQSRMLSPTLSPGLQSAYTFLACLMKYMPSSRLLGSIPWSPSHTDYGMSPMSGMITAVPLSMQRPTLQTDRAYFAGYLNRNQITHKLPRTIMGQRVSDSRNDVECPSGCSGTLCSICNPACTTG